ncbi:MAG: hypothetical protein KME43_18245 [Myxacorys chilensis ATA2-1-KO14]|jgi:pimeloyl-ACP methyl ester carboxylesterase|nr:hypothetical protein [Myxacorys chilensis ATA2-1-KO14]
MLNKLVKRLLVVSIIIFLMSLTTVVIKPMEAQIGTQNSVKPPKTTSNESTCTPRSDKTDVKLPSSYDRRNTYPALIMLPVTGGTPNDYFQGAFAEQYSVRIKNPFIVVLFDIQGSRNDWDPGKNFYPAIERCEKFVKSNLAGLISKYSIDPSRIVLGGSSLGGDLSWALSLRNPALFQSGTIVLNSQSTYRDEVAMRQLVANKSRFFMLANEVDEDKRLPEIRRAVDELAKYGVDHRFEIISDANYTEMLMRGVDYVLFNKDFSPRLSETPSKVEPT